MNTDYLKEMTQIALKYDIIVAEDLASYPFTYESSIALPKLYWDNDSKEYVWLTLDKIVRPTHD